MDAPSTAYLNAASAHIQHENPVTPGDAISLWSHNAQGSLNKRSVPIAFI